MIASTIIVLREVLEICLVVGIISAALKELRHRNKLLFVGVTIGVIISLCVALSLHKISNLFDGNGQEILNIIILSAAILCIAWTLFWMNTQGKLLHSKVSSVSKQLVNEEISMWPMISIISLSIAREGAELILFLHGISLTGLNSLDLVYGAMTGAVIGITLGLLLYNGLLKLSVKHFFKIINIMLILLAAGMASQLANYLNSSDIISSFSNAMWDSSWLISDQNIIAKLLHGLLGYSSHPSVLQVIFYFFTLTTMTFLVKAK